MKKRFSCVLFVFALIMSMSSMVFAEGENNVEFNPSGFTVLAVHQEYKESVKEYPMTMTLTNDTDEAVTITGDENNQLTIFVKSSPHPMAQKEAYEYDLYGGVTEIVVEAGETKEIVEVPTGSAISWRAFFHPTMVNDMDVKININGETKVFTGIDYGITGIIWNPLYIGQIVSTDNQDGTVTLKFDLTAYQEDHEFFCEGKSCWVESPVPTLVGPKTGLKKSEFGVVKDGPEAGEIIYAKESAETPGEYEVIWRYEPGTYEELYLNTAAGSGDFFVCYLPKDENGEYRIAESHLRRYHFAATITQTDDPVVIEHEDATLETAGATNIPKFVELYFKEVSDDIDENTMKTYGENVQEAAGNKEIVHIYDVGLLLDGEEITPNGPVKITIPLDAKMKQYVDLKIVYISDTGKVTVVEVYEVTDTHISFITDHFSYYAVVGSPRGGEGPKLPMTGTTMIQSPLLGLLLLGLGSVILKRKRFEH